MEQLTYIFTLLISQLLHIVGYKVTHNNKRTLPSEHTGTMACLLIPGLWATKNSLHWLASQLSDSFNSKNIYRLTYSALSPTKNTVRQLKETIDELIKRYKKIVIICHSFGGVITAMFLQDSPYHQCFHVITIASPLQGSVLIDQYEYICRRLKEMRAGILVTILHKAERALGFDHLINAIKQCPDKLPNQLSLLCIIATKDVVVGQSSYQHFIERPAIKLSHGHVNVTYSPAAVAVIKASFKQDNPHSKLQSPEDHWVTQLQ